MQGREKPKGRDGVSGKASKRNAWKLSTKADGLRQTSGLALLILASDVAAFYGQFTYAQSGWSVAEQSQAPIQTFPPILSKNKYCQALCCVLRTEI